MGIKAWQIFHCDYHHVGFVLSSVSRAVWPGCGATQEAEYNEAEPFNPAKQWEVGRSQRGRRCVSFIPYGHWKTTIFTAGLRLDGMVAPMVLDAPMNGYVFLVYMQQVLVPEPR